MKKRQDFMRLIELQVRKDLTDRKKRNERFTKNILKIIREKGNANNQR